MIVAVRNSICRAAEAERRAVLRKRRAEESRAHEALERRRLVWRRAKTMPEEAIRVRGRELKSQRVLADPSYRQKVREAALLLMSLGGQP